MIIVTWTDLKAVWRILPINYPFKHTVTSGQAIYQMDLHAINVMYELWA